MPAVATLADVCPQLADLLDSSQQQIRRRETAAAVFDLDNLLHRGFDRRTRRPRPQAGLDVHGICAALRARGVSFGAVCRNREFSSEDAQVWSGLGFRAVAARRNCDDLVINVANDLVRSGVETLVLVAGDGDYIPMVKDLHRKDIEVEVWARSANVSRRLASSVTRIQFVDLFIYERGFRSVKPAANQDDYASAAGGK